MVVQEVEVGSVMQEASPEQVAASHLPASTLGREEAEEKVVVQELELGSWCAGGAGDINTVMKYAYYLAYSIHRSIDIKIEELSCCCPSLVYSILLWPSSVTCMQAVVAAVAALRVVQVVASHFPAGITRDQQTRG